MGNRWKEHRSDQGAVVPEPSRKQYSCHLIVQNDGNNRAATGSQQSSDIRVHHNRVSFLFNKTHDLKRITEGSGVVVASQQLCRKSVDQTEVTLKNLSTDPAFDLEKLIYLAASVSWRPSVHHWNRARHLTARAKGGVVVARAQPREVVVRENGRRAGKTRSSPRPFTGALRGHELDDGMPISRPVLELE